MLWKFLIIFVHCVSRCNTVVWDICEQINKIYAQLWRSIHPSRSSYNRRSFFAYWFSLASIHQFPLTNGTVWLICTCTNIRPCVTTTSFGIQRIAISSIVILWQAPLIHCISEAKLLGCFLTMKDQVPLSW